MFIKLIYNEWYNEIIRQVKKELCSDGHPFSVSFTGTLLFKKIWLLSRNWDLVLCAKIMKNEVCHISSLLSLDDVITLTGMSSGQADFFLLQFQC